MTVFLDLIHESKGRTFPYGLFIWGREDTLLQFERYPSFFLALRGSRRDCTGKKPALPFYQAITAMLYYFYFLSLACYYYFQGRIV